MQIDTNFQNCKYGHTFIVGLGACRNAIAKRVSAILHYSLNVIGRQPQVPRNPWDETCVLDQRHQPQPAATVLRELRASHYSCQSSRMDCSC